MKRLFLPLLLALLAGTAESWAQASYYLKHPWGGGAWTWSEALTANPDGTYSITKAYGGNGCNWNTAPEDGGSQWVPAPTVGRGVGVGTESVFTLDPATGSIVIRDAAFTVSQMHLRGNFLEVMGTADHDTSWNTLLPMRRESGSQRWTRALVLPAGTYEFKFDVAGDWLDNWGLGASGTSNAATLGGTYTTTDGGGNIQLNLGEESFVLFTIDCQPAQPIFTLEACTHAQLQPMVTPATGDVETVTLYLSDKNGWGTPKVQRLSADGSTVVETQEMTLAYDYISGRSLYDVYRVEMPLNDTVRLVRFTSADGTKWTSTATYEAQATGFAYATEAQADGSHALELWGESPSPRYVSSTEHRAFCTVCHTHVTQTNTAATSALCGTLELTKGEAPAYTSGTYARVIFGRALKAGFNTLCLPFETTVARLSNGQAGAFVARLTAAAQNPDGTYNLHFTNETGTIEANTPYLYYSPTAQPSRVFGNVLMEDPTPHTPVWTDGWRMHGNYQPAFPMHGYYGVVNNTSYADIMRGASTSWLNAYTAYLEHDQPLPVRGATFIFGDEDVHTSIEALPLGTEDALQSPVAAYDLSGRRVGSAKAHGIYIINGKKVVK